ncbi:MAG: hypothetical protein PW792_01050 [Acidobacteriaceae bacterium]|nr:hypothetical protein [Acidobacteriaceae bacterium]
MPTPSILPIDGNRSSSRRNSHGGMAFVTELQMRQPQDGAADYAPLAIQAHLAGLGSEPEDARLTGSTRSLFRRALGLNILGLSAPVKAAPAKATVASTTAAETTARAVLEEITRQVA